MKRLVCLMLAVMMVAALLCGCGGSSGGSDETQNAAQNDASSSVDLTSVMNQINTDYGLGDLKVVEDTKKLKRYYEIEEADVKQFAAEFASDASVYLEVVLVEAVDEAAKDRIATQLANHLDSKVSEAKSYSPEQEEMLSKCKVSENGNFVSLIIGEDCEKIQSVVDAAVA